MPLDHTSILKTVETRWGLTALTARDAAAPDVGDVLTLKAARTDDPLKGVKVPKASGKDPANGHPSHLQQVHAELVSQLPVQNKQGERVSQKPELRTSAEHLAYIKSRTAAWKASRETTPQSKGQSAKRSASKKSSGAKRKAKKKS
jgi:phospholipase C